MVSAYLREPTTSGLHPSFLRLWNSRGPSPGPSDDCGQVLIRSPSGWQIIVFLSWILSRGQGIYFESVVGECVTFDGLYLLELNEPYPGTWSGAMVCSSCIVQLLWPPFIILFGSTNK